jgi:hypothetical protein
MRVLPAPAWFVLVIGTVIFWIVELVKFERNKKKPPNQ